jgi:hypothetical protein
MAQQVMSLPMGPDLIIEDQEKIVKIFTEAVRKLSIGIHRDERALVNAS